MSAADRAWDRRVRVEFIHGPLDGLIHTFPENEAIATPTITGRFDGQNFEGAYLLQRRAGGDWIAHYNPDHQENAA